MASAPPRRTSTASMDARRSSSRSTTGDRGRRRRPRSAAAALTLVAAAASAPTAAGFRAPSPRPDGAGRRTAIPRPRDPAAPLGGYGDGTRGRGGSRRPPSSTSLRMVFDFLKKASSDASEQMSAFATGLAKSRNQFLYSLEDLAAGGEGNFLDNLEDTLLMADLGTATTDDVMEEARFLREESAEIFGRDDVKALLRGKLLEALGAESGGGGGRYERVQRRAGRSLRSSASEGAADGDDGEEAGGSEDSSNSFALRFASDADPVPVASSSRIPLTIHFVMGANGMGKTTTIGKLAHRLRTEADKKVLLAACDTFRAGAVDQLERWAERAEVDCFSPSEATNGPSAVLYGALDKALGEGYDALLVDTSGRLSNNDALTAELVKMKKVIQKRMSTSFDEKVKPVPNADVPHETLLVIDAAQGRMALDSARKWDEAVGVTGLILTKLDGSAKGGSVVAVSRELGLPVKLVGVGEGMEDLRDFEPESFVDGLLGIGVAGGGGSKDEGKALASRLTQMRKERSDRARDAKKASTAATDAGKDGSDAAGPAGRMTLQGLDGLEGGGAEATGGGVGGEVELITAGGGGGGGGARSSRGKSKNKKKRKKKGRR
ncbi:hypothetical protein ACHAWF_019000 [Thalassiosira exigua]